MAQHFESLRLTAYLCPTGIPTIGYGATGPDIHLGLVWTREQADERLTLDAERSIAVVRRLCPQAQDAHMAALADFAFNLGPTRLASSTLRRRYNAGDLAGARHELTRWVYGGGRALPGLVRRRAAEAALLV